jgi:hypothetical protein
MSNNDGKSIESAPRDGQEIMILGRLNLASDAPRQWILGRSDGALGWCSGADNALVQIHGASLWKPKPHSN